ncbi:hypothetical protein BCR43DRAFT_258801 [Syncephalastrum racemosum]|uniref:Uncharacterized protein n=1 Tax=Syncephalastrum racemosum TaxID=13706 RepID=A0A1X2HGC6_SYNRA|nr:hypothetical protein BCR43DRAFT_258801 [Syncephalastrum racemosum]
MWCKKKRAGKCEVPRKKLCLSGTIRLCQSNFNTAKREDSARIFHFRKDVHMIKHRFDMCTSSTHILLCKPLHKPPSYITLFLFPFFLKIATPFLRNQTRQRLFHFNYHQMQLLYPRSEPIRVLL